MTIDDWMHAQCNMHCFEGWTPSVTHELILFLHYTYLPTLFHSSDPQTVVYSFATIMLVLKYAKQVQQGHVFKIFSCSVCRPFLMANNSQLRAYIYYTFNIIPQHPPLPHSDPVTLQGFRKCVSVFIWIIQSENYWIDIFNIILFI